MDIRVAEQQDVGQLAQLLWLHAAHEERAKQGPEPFALAFEAWWSDHKDTHHAFVAGRLEIVGMAWMALLARVPRPGAIDRFSADIQSVFVLPQHRGEGLGSALVLAATHRAFALGAGRVTVQSGRRAVPVYERLGFVASPQLLEIRSG